MKQPLLREKIIELRIQRIFVIVYLSILSINTYAQETLKTNNIESVLYLGQHNRLDLWSENVVATLERRFNRLYSN